MFFAGAGTVSWPKNRRGMFESNRVFTEVGYGLRVHAILAGLRHFVMGVDLAIPITPTTREYAVERADGSFEMKEHRPFKVVLAVTSAF